MLNDMFVAPTQSKHAFSPIIFPAYLRVQQLTRTQSQQEDKYITHK